MTVDIQFIKMPFSETLNYYVSQKLEALAERYGWILNADVFYKLEQDPTGNDKICEIGLKIPGPVLFASSRDENFGIATKRAIKELEKQLIKRKNVLKAR